MARSLKFPFLVRQGKTWHARLDIPMEVRDEFGGKASFSRSTKLADAEQAYHRASPWIAEWKTQIEAARSHGTPTHIDEIAREFAAATGHQDLLLIREVASFVAKRLCNQSESQWMQALAANQANPVTALQSIGGDRAVQAAHAITHPTTPFASKLDEFKAAKEGKLAPKTLHEYCIDIERFGAGLSIETFATKDVQAFVDARDKVVSTITIRKQVSGLSTYWEWLAHHDETLRPRRPFQDVSWPKAYRKRPDPTRDDFVVNEDDNDGLRFTLEEVCTLWDYTQAKCKIDLHDACVISAYTGMRRSGIFSLHAKTVHLDAETPHLHLDEKLVEEGWRTVPLHPALVPTLARRLANQQPDGYLFRGSKNKIKERATIICNPMGAMMRVHGFAKGYGFHSFRRTFVGCLKQQAVPELHAACLVGHTVKSITYGLYGGKLPVAQSLAIMVNALQYPRLPVF